MTIQKMPVSSPEAQQLMGELSAKLTELTGCSGASGFDFRDMENPRALFAVAQLEGRPVGCGALREVSDNTAEIKRVYACQSGHGIGSRILKYLEAEARRLSYTRLILETRKANQKAVQFYLRCGYQPCENYGRYRGLEDAICFSKRLPPLSGSGKARYD